MNKLHATQAQWLAVFTKFRCEKSVMQALIRKGIQAYVPLKPTLRVYGYRKRIVELPLISCYVFVRIIHAEYVKVLETENVINYVKFGKDIIPIPEQEINTLKQVVGDMEADVIAEPKFYKGDEVEVITGELKGLEGKLIELPGKRNFVVELKNFGYSLRMHIKPQYLRKKNLQGLTR